MMNEFLVTVYGGNVMLKPVPSKITKDQAINLAAWIVALVDPEEIEFTAALMEVQSS